MTTEKINVLEVKDMETGKMTDLPPSAPVGVDEVVRKVCERLDKVADYAHTIDGETVVVALSNLPAVLARALSEALAQQPAAAGEEIMVNAAHDVYTLPLHPSGLSSGPRFVVHVPGPEQPAAPSGEAVATVAGEFSEVRQDGEVYWLQTVLLKRPQQLPFGAPLYTAPQQPAAVDEAMVFRLAVWMAKHDGCDDPHRLIYEGSPPVLWGEVWNRYEYDARAALTAALVQPGGSDNGR
jgi:hypothetical protein